MPRLIDADVLLAELQTIFDEREEEERFTGGRAKGPTWNDALYCVLTAPEVKSGWIPVTEGLPNPYQQCWFTTTDGEVIQHHFDGLVSHYKAWMPFEKPEPWKGEGDESDKD